jgi:hypothetical protein
VRAQGFGARIPFARIVLWHGAGAIKILGPVLDYAVDERRMGVGGVKTQAARSGQFFWADKFGRVSYHKQAELS